MAPCESVCPDSAVHVVDDVYVIDYDYCKGCGICTEFCPSAVLKTSTNLNSKGYYPPLVAKQDACHGCRLCELLCPEFAIFIVNEWLHDQAC